MLRFRLFKLPRAKSYNYIPVYYDERKEQLEKRRCEQISDNYENRIKGSFRRSSKLKSKSEAIKSNIRLLVIIIILSALALYFLYY